MGLPSETLLVANGIPHPADSVDMEAYALAKVCLHEQIPFACVKYITDGADGAASCDWENNLKDAAMAFSRLILKFQ
jgi:adenosylhomocysteine nucleosidase